MLAWIGWLAQLCLPMAHAAVMADGGGRAGVWCGKGSPVLRAKLAELPADIREILKGSLGHDEHASDACAELCGTPQGQGAPLPSSSVAAHAAIADVPIDAGLGNAVLAPRLNRPPVRGPPS